MWRSLFALILLMVKCAFPLDPQTKIHGFVHTAWTEKDGAPDDVRALAQTNDGYIWIGTGAGLFRFDGVRFSACDMRDPGFAGQLRVVHLLATRDGSLWIVFVNGAVSRIRDGRITGYSQKDGLPPTLSLAQSPSGALLAGTVNGIWRLSGQRWQNAGAEWKFPAKQASGLFYDKVGTLWAVTESHIVYLSADQTKFVTLPNAVGPAGNFAEAPNGTIWLAEVGRSARSVPRAGDRTPVTEIRVGADCVLFDRSGSLWIGTAGDGLRRVAHPDQIRGLTVAQFGPEAEQFAAPDGLSANYVVAVLEDREGTIWWGTHYGIDQFRDSAFTVVPTLHPDIPASVLACQDGHVWSYSTNPAPLLRLDAGHGEELSHVTTGFFGVCLSNGGLLYSTGRFAERYANGAFIPIPRPPATDFLLVASIAVDRTGGLWLLDIQKGVFRIENRTITKILDKSGAIQDWGILYTDSRDRVWIAQMFRVSVYDHGKLQSFGANEGAPSGPIFAFAEDRAGNVWMAGDGGLRKFDHGMFRSPSARNGFPVRATYGLAQDDDGRFWMATDVGVLRASAQDLDRAIADPEYRVPYEIFDSLDGLPGKMRRTFPMPTVSRGTGGRIWFAATRGIAFVDPKRLPGNPVPPPVQVNSIVVGGKESPAGAGMAFTHRQNDLEIRYTALSFSVPERVRFRYKLDGKDVQWVDAGTRRTAFYTSLSPSVYTFHVIACNDQGIWNTTGASWTFRIIPAFYQADWFKWLCVLTGVLLLGAGYKLRMRQMAAAMNARFNERLAERTRLARDLHDTLLQTVQASRGVAELALSQPADANQLRNAMERLFGWLTRATDEGRAALKSLRMSNVEGCGLAEALRRAGEECQRDTPIRFVIDTKGNYRELHPLVRDEVYRIGYEAIRNACLHSGATSLRVDLNYTDDLVLRVRDNGKGIEPDIARHGKAGRFGIAGMYERAAQIRGQLKVTSSDPSRLGTEVELIVSAHHAFLQPAVSRFGFFQRKGRTSSDSK